MIDFLRKHYTVKENTLNFDDTNKKYIFYNEILEKNGKKYNSIIEKKEDLNNYSTHSPSCSKLYNVLDKLNIDNSDSIIDIGSGRGFALSIMNLFPFKKIAGVEISKKDFDICMDNLKALDINNVKVKNININDFNDYNSFNYFYFFQPFKGEFFEGVIKNITKKGSIVIYKNLHDFEKSILKKYKFEFVLEEKGNERNYYVFTKL
jgi:16S rRNA G527 N7-methylase RsmG